MVAAGRSLRADEAALTRMMWVWLVTGVLVILSQRFSWWTYHMALLFVPTALLAVRGVDVVLTWMSERTGAGTWQRTGVCALLIVPALAAALFPARDNAGELLLARSDPQQGIPGFQRSYQQYGEAARIADMVDWDTAQPGRIFVFGSPLVYLLSDRRPALPIVGGLSVLLPEQWRTLIDELNRRRPPYVFIKSGARKMIADDLPEMMSILDSRYTAINESEDGRWYRLTAPQG